MFTRDRDRTYEYMRAMVYSKKLILIGTALSVYAFLLVWPIEFEDYNEVETAIKKAFIDYNTIRPHSSIEYLSPIEFKKRCIEDNKFRKKYEKINRKVNISIS